MEGIAMIARKIPAHALAAIFLGMSVGCLPDAEPPLKSTEMVREPILTAELGREALLERMRSKELSRFDADEWARVPVQEGENGWYHFGGVFLINPATKKYTMEIGPGPGVRACTFTYEGDFVLQRGRWVARPAKMIGSALGGEK
jgi:hypothetical protein